MIRLVALDIDGILIKNKFSKFFGNGNSLWLSKHPTLKRCALRLMEVIEWIIKIRHEKNGELIDFINSLKKESGNGFHVFIITDRSTLGLKNVWQKISGLLIDYIQIRGGREAREKKDEIKNRLGIPETEILISQSLKSHKDVLCPLAVFAKQKDIKSDEILIIDDNQDFLRVAKTFLGFKVFSDAFIEKKENPEIVFHSSLSRIFNRA